MHRWSTGFHFYASRNNVNIHHASQMENRTLHFPEWRTWPEESRFSPVLPYARHDVCLTLRWLFSVSGISFFFQIIYFAEIWIFRSSRIKYQRALPRVISSRIFAIFNKMWEKRATYSVMFDFLLKLHVKYLPTIWKCYIVIFILQIIKYTYVKE